MTRKSLIISLLAISVAATPLAAQAETVVVDHHHPVVVAHPHRHVAVVHRRRHVVVAPHDVHHDDDKK